MEKEILQREPIEKENLPKVLEKIALTRETKGTSETLIPYIHFVRGEAQKLGELSTVVQLYQEEFLSGQHMVMEERSKRFSANPFRLAKGIFVMESTSREMEKYLGDSGEKLDAVVKARIYRYLGRYADYKHQYHKSEEYYRKGLLFFDQSENIDERFNKLEFLGFLSYSLLKQGKTKEGLEMATSTLSKFDDSEEGKWLKENSYYTWAVWKSGIEIRTAEHLLNSKEPDSRVLAKGLIKVTGDTLTMPDGTKDVFQLRIDELNKVKSLLP
jgi:hypothetical protein